MDPQSVLEQLCSRAARYSIDLNGKVERNPGNGPLPGSTSLVYKGLLCVDGEQIQVAVKTFRSGPPGDEATLKRILREVHLWSKLHHENIVRMLGICTEFDSTISIVSDWMEMGDAHTYVQNKDNDPCPLFADIARGLHYLHNHEDGPIFHGDLKGPNVLVSGNRRALLTDFGFSALTKSTFSLTINSPKGGSLPWMAPELLDDGKISAAGDVWAFGMTVLELFTRSPPFHDCGNISSIMVRILRGPPERPTQESTCHRMTDAWWELCSSCWRKRPSSRPAILEIMDRIHTVRMSPNGSNPSTSMGIVRLLLPVFRF
ncbi:hypothetical protein ID866_9944 [Astraeus odoratus]|nr:hypothetical protein ID866_9944 [Astraeus odoratus]